MDYGIGIRFNIEAKAVLPDFSYPALSEAKSSFSSAWSRAPLKQLKSLSLAEHG